MHDQKQALIVGCGYVGGVAAHLFHNAGWAVMGMVHSEESAAALADAGFPVVTADIGHAPDLKPIADAQYDVILLCASSGRGGAAQYRHVFYEGTKNALAAWPGARCLFVSSTSVYAQTDASWVTEESPAQPERETGRILRETEESVLDAGGVVARLAGIYGPVRSVLLRRFLDGTAIIEGGGIRWINQIHRDDAASALFHLAHATVAPGIYNVADDTPMTQLECLQWLATRFGKNLPPEGPIDRDRKRGWTNKRVSNAKLRTTGWKCVHPDFRGAIEREQSQQPPLPIRTKPQSDPKQR